MPIKPSFRLQNPAKAINGLCMIGAEGRTKLEFYCNSFTSPSVYHRDTHLMT